MFWPCKSVTDPSLPGVVQGGLTNLAQASDSVLIILEKRFIFFNLLKGAMSSMAWVKSCYSEN